MSTVGAPQGSLDPGQPSRLPPPPPLPPLNPALSARDVPTQTPQIIQYYLLNIN